MTRIPGRACCIALAVILLAAASAFAATYYEEPFAPLSPVVMGEGGSFIASAQGYNAFFYNPAGFSRSSGAFTLSSNSWIYSRPDLLISQVAQAVAGTQTSASLLNFIDSQVTTGGLGVGSSIGIGYVGDGFGLAGVLIVDSMLYGQTLLGATGDMTATLGFIGGLSLPLEVWGVKIHVGADIRPMIRIHTLIANSAAVSIITALTSGGSVFGPLNSSTAYYGSGIGLDLGVIAELGWFQFGMAVRDLGGTQFNYTSNSFGTVMGTLGSQGNFPSGAPVADTYLIPMDISVGVAFHPDLGRTNLFFDPTISFDMRDIVGAIDGSANVWTLLHAGTAIRLMNTFTFRAGLNQGYLTVGGGVKLLFFDMNLAIFTQELGVHLGDRPAAGTTASLDFRF